MSKYTVGNTVYLYSWDELVERNEIDEDGDILLSSGYYWNKSTDNKIPLNRKVTISKIDWNSGKEEPWYRRNNIDNPFFNCMIKCHVGEYYLQQIKDELDEFSK